MTKVAVKGDCVKYVKYSQLFSSEFLIHRHRFARNIFVAANCGHTRNQKLKSKKLIKSTLDNVKCNGIKKTNKILDFEEVLLMY